MMKIASVDTRGGSDLFMDWLVAHFPDVEVLPEERYQEADVLFCDEFGDRARRFRGVKVLITAENHAPDLNEYDYTLTHAYGESDRCHRLPYWQYVVLMSRGLRGLLEGERPPMTAEQLLAERREFCAFVCRNGACRKRNRFVQRLSAARKVNCAGAFMHNVETTLSWDYMDKIRYARHHYFTVAYENEACPGYQTEKITDALMARSIPIYWGNERVAEEFNPKAFVHARDFRSDAELVDYLLALADDPQRMAAMLSEPPFRDPHALQRAEEELAAFVARILSRGPGAVQRTRRQRLTAVLRRYYGHGLFRTLRYLSRRLRGKL